MKKIKLNQDMGKFVEAHGYVLEPKEKYILSIKDELDQQQDIMNSIHIMGLTALKDYHTWLKTNNFDANEPNPTNDFVSSYYGEKPLWTTKLSQGIVVKAEEDDDYYIVMECSRESTGFKYTQIIVTLGGCL